MWTGDAGKERSMHVGVAQAPAGRNPILKCLLEFSASGTLCSDDVHSSVRTIYKRAIVRDISQ